MQLAIGGWAEGWAKGLREKMPAAVGNMWESEQAEADARDLAQLSENGGEEEEVIIEESVDGVSRKWVAPGAFMMSCLQSFANTAVVGLYRV